MKNNDEQPERRSGRTFAQEMQQAFIDWMKRLPFITTDDAKDTRGEDLTKESAERERRGPVEKGTEGR